MEHNYWSTERWRFVAVLAAGALGGFLFGQWLISFIIALVIYIGWLLFKLQQLHNWLESGGKPLAMPDSNGIWERINFHIHTTQKKSNRRKKRMASLLKRFQGIITSLPYATIILTGNNEIDWANKHSANLLRIDLKRDRGLRVENLIRAPEVRKLLKKNKQKEIEITSAYDDQLKLAIQLIPVQSDMKLLIARNISERVHLQQMRRNFIANASHELRTPLTVIAGYLEIMQGEEDLPEPLRPAVAAAAEQSERMQSIIDDLLTLSRLENSELKEEKNTVLDMSAIIRRICTAETDVDENNHSTDTSQVDPQLKLRGAEAEITSVCTNLIHNAFRYTPANTTISIIWQKLPSGEAMLIVQDEGEGIPAEHISHLTERFYRVDKGRSQETGGTGLGLAIVLHIVQRHGGKLNIRSKMGVGSEFEAIFPANRVLEPDLESQSIAS